MGTSNAGYNTLSFANLQQEERNYGNEEQYAYAEDALLAQAMSSKKVVMMYDVQLQLQASGGSNDTQMCHRFINFETYDFEHNESSVQAMINDYLRTLT